MSRLISLRKFSFFAVLFCLSGNFVYGQEIWAWGGNLYGQLGLGTIDTAKRYPQKVGNYNSWQIVRTNTVHTMAMKADNTIWAWGSNIEGELGNSTNISSTVPVLVNADTDWAFIETGGGTSAAIKSNGTLWTWGANTNGGLGLGNYVNSNYPQQVGSDTDWVLISSRAAPHFIAIKSDGTLWGWGSNSFGQLGNGTNISSNVPIQIGSDTDWQYASANNSQTLALKTNGTVWYCGQFGTSTLQQLGNDTDWVHISQGADHVLALKQDGSLWAWGSNGTGAFGNGMINGNTVMTAVHVGTATDWLYVDAGTRFSLAVKNDGSLWTWGWNIIGQTGCLADSAALLIPHKIAEPGSFQSVSAGFYSAFALGSNVQLAVQEIHNDHKTYKLDVFPVPNNGNFSISLNMPAGERLELALSNIIGQVVHTQTIITHPGQIYSIRPENKLTPGIYSLDLKGANIDRSAKIEVR